MESRLGWHPFRKVEFQESDMWDFMEEIEGGNGSTVTECRKPEQSSIGPVSRQVPSAAMLIPRANKNAGREPKLAHHSAPVNVPDWSKIYGKSPAGPSCHCDDVGSCVGSVDEEEEGIRVPPHEWVAMKHTASLSVCEGAGRTLKGRDLRRVRHAVLTKTGFI